MLDGSFTLSVLNAEIKKNQKTYFYLWMFFIDPYLLVGDLSACFSVSLVSEEAWPGEEGWAESEEGCLEKWQVPESFRKAASDKGWNSFFLWILNFL
jgi:hypothetical protein